jgi:hypothetical protein
VPAAQAPPRLTNIDVWSSGRLAVRFSIFDFDAADPAIFTRWRCDGTHPA